MFIVRREQDDTDSYRPAAALLINTVALLLFGSIMCRIGAEAAGSVLVYTGVACLAILVTVALHDLLQTTGVDGSTKNSS